MAKENNFLIVNIIIIHMPLCAIITFYLGYSKSKENDSLSMFDKGTLNSDVTSDVLLKPAFMTRQILIIDALMMYYADVTLYLS